MNFSSGHRRPLTDGHGFADTFSESNGVGFSFSLGQRECVSDVGEPKCIASRWYI